MSNTIQHFEVAADDVDRAKSFYGGLFGWEIETPPNFEGEYWFIKTPDGGPDGGMMKRQMPEQHITAYVTVDSVDESSAKASELGGQVVMAKSAVPGMGWFSIILDTEGNALGLWQSDESAA